MVDERSGCFSVHVHRGISHGTCSPIASINARSLGENKGRDDRNIPAALSSHRLQKTNIQSSLDCNNASNTSCNNGYVRNASQDDVAMYCANDFKTSSTVALDTNGINQEALNPRAKRSFEQIRTRSVCIVKENKLYYIQCCGYLFPSNPFAPTNCSALICVPIAFGGCLSEPNHIT